MTDPHATGSRAATPVELLRRIREWDHLPLTGDGPYWLAEIDKTLATHATPDRAAEIVWTGRFVCKVCGWQWIASGCDIAGTVKQFEHTCTGPPVVGR